MALDKMVDSTKLDNALTATADAIREKGGGAIGSGSGAIVTVTDALAAPVAGLSVDIELVQSGSGDPSPTNIRSISGWTGANIYVRGINLWDGTWENGNISESTGANDGTSTSYFRSAGYIPLKGGQSYYPYSSHRTSNYRQFYYDKDKNFLGFTGTAWGAIKNTATLEYADKICFMRFRVYGAHVDDDLTTSFNIPSTNTTTNVYGGTTYAISFGSAGTVYGGTLDVTEGTLTVTHRYMLADGVNIKTTGGYGAAGSKWLPCIVLSTADKVDPSTPIVATSYLKTSGVNVQNDENSAAQGNNGAVIALHIGTMQGTDGTHGYSSTNEVHAAINAYLQTNPLQICYKLATPQTYQLTSTEVTLLAGTNNVWSDTGNITLKYPIDSELIPFDLTNETGFANSIGSISTGVDISDTTATASDVLPGKYFYTADGTKTQGSITTLGATTYTPGTTNQTIASGQYLTGVQTILGDSNLVAGNIKKDISIFGITGTHVGGPTSSDAVLTVTVTHGSSVIAEKGTSVLSPVIWTTSENSALDNAIFIINSSMFDSTAWTITATLSGDTISDTITIDSNLQYTLDLVRLYLYKDGDEYTSYTGGWSKISQSGSTVTKNANNIYMKASSATIPAAVQTENPFDCTRYSALHFIVTDTYSQASRLGLVYVKGNFTASDFVALETINNIGESYHVIVSISNLTGSYYPTVQTTDYAADKFYIHRIWME